MGEIFYTITTLLIRLSIGFYLLRICILKLHLWIIKITMSVITLLSVLYFVFVTAQYNPVNYFWLQFSGGKGKCFSALTVQNITISYAVFAAITDIVFGVLPIFVIWNLKMNRRAKMVVGGLLALGIMEVPLS
jgi:Fungal rhodopsin domain